MKEYLCKKNVLVFLIIGVLSFGLPLTASSHPNSPSLLNDLSAYDGQTELQRLLQEAQDTGRVRIIVELDLSFKPEGELHSIAAVQSQRRGIKQAQQALIDRFQIGVDRNVRKMKYVPQIVMEVDASELSALMSDPSVLHIHEDALLSLSLSSSVPHIGAPAVWAEGYSGDGQVVAVLDTGVDSDHPFLTGKVVSEACYSNYWGEGTTLCPNGQKEQIGSGAAEPCTITSCSHGTHVAGIAVGKGDTFSGVAREADLIAIQVFTRFENPICSDNGQSSSPCILTYFSDVILGLERVYELQDTFHIASVNLSIGGGSYTAPCPSDSMASIINNLKSVGIATVVSSGNNGYTSAIGTPACIPNAISVASTSLSDVVSSYSNVAYFLDFYAPGEWIYSSIPGGTYAYASGTSMAAPHVTGTWALIKSKIPDGSVDFIYNVLANNGVLVDDTRSGGTILDIPRIQVDEAIDVIDVKYVPQVAGNSTP
jgi:subtilisin